jgi:ABC-2 type transport system permease protein
MKKYLAVLRSRFQTLLQYRAAALAGIGTQLFFGLVRMMIYDGFFHSSTQSQPMTSEQTVTYIWLGQALLLLALFDVDKEVAALIRSGNVAYELTKPADLYAMWFARAFSGRAAPLLMRSTPIFVIAGLFFGLRAPASFTAGFLFVISAFVALLLSASMVVLITTTLLWTISGQGISRLAPVLIFFFSGIVIPLPFFPDRIQRFVDFLPSRGLIDTPLRIYVGHLGPDAALVAMAHQFVWVLVLLLIGRWVLIRGLRKLVIQGG